MAELQPMLRSRIELSAKEKREAWEVLQNSSISEDSLLIRRGTEEVCGEMLPYYDFLPPEVRSERDFTRLYVEGVTDA